MRISYAALAVAVTSFVSAQHVPTIPQCALSCFVSTFKSDGCSSLTDFACHCSKPGFQEQITPCVQKACTSFDQVTAVKTVQDTCASVVNGLHVNPVAKRGASGIISGVSSTNTVGSSIVSGASSIVSGGSVSSKPVSSSIGGGSVASSPTFHFSSITSRVSGITTRVGSFTTKVPTATIIAVTTTAQAPSITSKPLTTAPQAPSATSSNSSITSPFHFSSITSRTSPTGTGNLTSPTGNSTSPSVPVNATATIPPLSTYSGAAGAVATVAPGAFIALFMGAAALL